MGSGGKKVSKSRIEDKKITHQRAPTSKPPFTLRQIKNAIPPHCFNRSLLRSFSYVLFDLTLSFLLYHIATSYFHLLPHPLLPYISWPIYWILQGCMLTSVWIIAHECGHHAFSDYQLVDDVVGLVLHTALLVPYFSWKYSHRRHHSNIGSMELDEVFVPKPKSKMPWYNNYFNNPPGRLLVILVTLTVGWPLYLAFNISGREYDRFTCHYDPNGPIFSNRERLQVYISDLGIMSAIYVLYKIVMAKGFVWLVCVYGVPMIVVNVCVVLITYLQHTHPSLPHYGASEWDWLRGALATVDRDYGVLNKVFHNSTNTHVVHHLFSTMPHYHAMEATNVLKPILGEYYSFDATPIWKALWREARECLFVEPDEDGAQNGVFWYRNKF